MALHVARGLFRLWLVLAVLWIGGVGVVGWWSYPHAPNPDEYSASDGLERFGTAQERFERDAKIIADEQWWTIKAVILLALVPPAALSVWGAAFTWAFRGFR